MSLIIHVLGPSFGEVCQHIQIYPNLPQGSCRKFLKDGSKSVAILVFLAPLLLVPTEQPPGYTYQTQQ
jgi:hypothetical protein